MRIKNYSMKKLSIPELKESDKKIPARQNLSLDTVLEEARRRLYFQFTQINGFNAKNGIVLGIAGIMFTLLITYILDNINNEVSLILPEIALIPIFISIILSFIVIFICNYWKIAPRLDELRDNCDNYIDKPPENTKLNIHNDYIKAIETNEIFINKISNIINTSHIFLLIGFISLAIFVLQIIL
jgi:hypothetical protein